MARTYKCSKVEGSERRNNVVLDTIVRGGGQEGLPHGYGIEKVAQDSHYRLG